MYSKKASQLCYLGSYLEVINNYGYDISEEYLFGLTQGIIFKYKYIHKNKEVENFVSHEDRICIVGAEDNREIINECYGIKFSTYYENDKIKLLKFIKNELMEGRQVITYMDVYYLNYHPQYMKVHGQTNVIVYKMNDDQVFLLDKHVTTIPASVYQGSVSKQDFLQAIIIGENNYNCEEMGVVINRKTYKDSYINISYKVYNTALFMLQNDFNNYGICGINFLADEITKWQSMWDEDELVDVLKQGYLHITSRGGPAISRRIYSQFLRKYYGHFYDMENIAAGFEECAKKWNGISIKFFRGMYKIDSSVFDLTSLKVKEVAKMEEELFKKLLLISEEFLDA